MVQKITYLLITVSWCVLLQNKGAGLSSDLHFSSSQVSPIDHDEDSGVVKRWLEDKTGGKENHKSISEICKGTTVEQRYVLVGENVTLLSNTGGQDREVSMYTESERYLAQWDYKDGHQKTNYKDLDYSSEMDEKGAVGLTNAKMNYTGHFIFKCNPPCEHPCVKLNVLGSFTEEFKITKMLDNQGVIMKHLENLTEETKKIAKRLDNQEVIMKHLENLTEETKKIAKRLDNQEVIMKHLENLTEETKKIAKRLDIQEVIMKHLGESHSKTDNNITAILVILVTLIILLIIMIICYVCCERYMPKTSKKSLTEDQVEKGLCDLRVFMEKNLEKLTDDQTRALIQKFLDIYPKFVMQNLEKLTDDQIKELILKCLGAPLMFMAKHLDRLDRTEDHHTSSLQESAAIDTAEYNVAQRLPEDETGGKDNQKMGFSETSFIDNAAVVKISLPEMKSIQYRQPERNMSKYFTKNDTAGQPLLDQ